MMKSIMDFGSSSFRVENTHGIALANTL